MNLPDPKQALGLTGDVQKAPPCVRCNQPSECEVWSHRLCYNCTARWELAADESLSCTSSAAAHLDFTRAWLAREKRGAA
jgi:hypothetical protein